MPATPIDELASGSACFTCLGVSIGNSFDLALWDSISQSISPTPPGGETFYILSNVGDALISQVGDNLVYQ